MKMCRSLLLLIVAALMSVFCVRQIYLKNSGGDKADFSRLIYYPSAFVDVVSLEFHGVVADYLMLNLMVFHGQKIMDKTDVEPDEWELTYKALILITDLDPRFFDPYLMAETSLPWDAGMVEEANHLLLKAVKYRKNDYRPYFFLWFNHYYFLHDPGAAGEYLQEAARIPGTPKFYKTLAARMTLYSGEISAGILFLREMISQTNDPNTKKFLQKRLDALKRIFFLENKIQEYEQEYGHQPESLDDLVSCRIIESLPQDPYGGKFFLQKNGRVYTTSKLVQQKK